MMATDALRHIHLPTTAPRQGLLEDFMSVVAFEKGCVVNRDGSLSRGFALALPEEEGLASWDGLIHELSGALKGLPIGTALQKIDLYWPEEAQISMPSDASFFHRKTLEHQASKTVLQHHSYLFLRFFNRTYTPVVTYLGEKQPWHSINWDEQLAIIEGACTAFMASLPPSLSIKALSKLGQEQLLYQYLNLAPDRACKGLERAWVSLPDRVSMGVELQGVMMRGQAEEVHYEVKNNLGLSGVSSPFLWPITHLMRFPHIVCQEIKLIDSASLRRQKSLEIDMSAQLQLRARSRELAEHRQAQLMELEKTLQERDTRLSQLSLTVFTWHSDSEQLQRQTDQIKSGLSKSGLEVTELGPDTAARFLAHAPGATGFLEGCYMPLETALAYLPFITPRKGDREGVYLQDRHGTPLCYDPFKYSLDNQHVFLFGPSGSGKSFFNGKMIKDRYEAGHTMVVIDSGGTYRFLFKALEGTYIEYNPEQPLSLNPFLVKPKHGKYIPDTDKVAFLVQFLAKMWKGDLKQYPLVEVEYALLAKFLTAYYLTLPQKRVPHLRDFCQWLPGYLKEENIEDDLFDLRQFLLVLSPFTEGIYKEHFNALEVEHLAESRLLCFELEAVKGDRKLYPLVIQVLFDYILQLVSSQPKQKKFIDIEEGWSMLDDASESYIEAFFRKGRKTNTSIRMITQNVTEIQESKIAGAMKNNAATFILLYNDKASVREDIAAFLGMNEFDLEKYASLRRKDHYLDGYREVLIKEMDHSTVWRVSLSLYEHALLTSRPDERHRVQELAHEEGSAERGIARWAREVVMSYQ